MTRPWPYPDLRSGTTLHHITDTHVGNRPENDNYLSRVQDQLCSELRVSHAGHVHSGDIINSVAEHVTQDAKWLRFEGVVTAADGLPFVKVPGNHDLDRADKAGVVHRSSAEWAAAYGMPSFNTVTDIGDLRILGVGPDEYRPGEFKTGEADGKFELSMNTITWLDEQLTAAGSRPCVMVTHTPPWEQVDFDYSIAPRGPLDDLVGGHDNMVMWLSGHRHINVQLWDSHAVVATIGGRKVFCVNGPAAGGQVWKDNPDYPWETQDFSLFVTYLGDAVDIRYRDHLSRAWTTSTYGPIAHLLLTA